MKVKIIQTISEDIINLKIMELEQHNTIIDIKFNTSHVYYNDNNGGRLHAFNNTMIIYKGKNGVCD